MVSSGGVKERAATSYVPFACYVCWYCSCVNLCILLKSSHKLFAVALVILTAFAFALPCIPS